MGKLSDKDKKKLRYQLYERDGKKCHYCGIEEEDFPKIWGDKFYGGIKRGQILEIDRKDNNRGYSLENSVLACALCNMAKSDKFTYDEFKNVGDVIRKIWQQRKSSVPSVTA
jgi:5-methylcytosine-specific restriction endonuclease McrA